MIKLERAVEAVPSPIQKPIKKRVLPWVAHATAHPPPPPPSPRIRKREIEASARDALYATPYTNPKLLPRSFARMRNSFERKGVVDVHAARRAREWCKSRRKMQNAATLAFDEIWNELRVVAKDCKSKANVDEAREKYAVFADTMAHVFQPIATDNVDGLDADDFGGLLSGYGHGAVEAAWNGCHPYDSE
jgi:hypothetical protein